MLKENHYSLKNNTGGVILEFAISISLIFMLLQASITLSEKIAVKNWIDNTAFQLIYSSSQFPNDQKVQGILNKTNQLFSIFNNSSRTFWRLGAFKSYEGTTAINGYTCDNARGYLVPKACWLISPNEKIVRLNIQGSLSSSWYGAQTSTTEYSSPYLSNSTGYYDGSSYNTNLPSSPAVFDCDPVTNICTGGFCYGNGCQF